MGDGVGDAAEQEAAGAGHALVADHDQVGVLDLLPHRLEERSSREAVTEQPVRGVVGGAQPPADHGDVDLDGPRAVLEGFPRRGHAVARVVRDGERRASGGATSSRGVCPSFFVRAR